jgi:phosphoglycolate phosphatase
MRDHGLVRYSTVLFDLDGTLTDSGLGIGRSVAFALDALGKPALSDAQLRSFVGPPLPESFAAVGLDKVLIDQAIGKYREYFATTGMFENAVYPGIEPLLASLRHAGTRLAVATSKPEVFARRIVDHFGLTSYFDHVAGSGLDGSHRHKADVIALALAALGFDADSDPEVRAGICMVGDRAHDAVGAAAHGLDFIGVAWGYAAPGELAEAGARDVAGTPSELSRLLGGP